MRVLLIQPDYQVAGFGFRLAAMPEPLALEILAGCLSEHEVRILDMRIESDLLGALEDFHPNLVAVTALTTEVYTAREVLLTVKEHNSKTFTVIGGHHCTLAPQDFQVPQVDAIALGEGEFVFPQLLAALAERRGLAGVHNLIWRDRDGRFIRNRRVIPPGRDMDSVPLPRRDLVGKYREHYFFLFDKPDSSVATGRGCPYRCSFCSVHEFYEGRTRQMSARRVLEEVKLVDTRHITFVDDNFLMNVRRENEIADLIRAEGVTKSFSMEARTDSIVKHPELVEKWVGVGLYAVLLGLEGATDDVLAGVNKSNAVAVNDEAIHILQSNGVIIWGAFIVDPDWSADDFQRLRDYVRAREITHTQFTVLTPLIGTELYRRRRHELLTHDYTCYDTLHAVLPTRLPRVEFYRQLANLYRQTDLGPYYDLVRDGKLTIDDVRRGKRMLDAMGHWEYYLDKDPILGAVRKQPVADSDAVRAGVAAATPLFDNV
jgi:radical SAM superfamily enzyme YgiQ (UPF0313 family)